MQKYFKISSFYLLFGLVMGIFSREFTKFNNFSGYTVLKSVHTHTLVLGFLFFIIVLLLEKNFTISNNKSFNKWIVLYNLGLIYLIITLSIRGILQVIGSDFVGLSHIAGLGHAILGISLVWFLAIVNKELKVYDSNILSKNK
ncbi:MULTISPECIES: DUF2871 domain-containing protein [Romboutsia]|jgi:hypothetical protein|uniref:DUF2871 domain-containing protein n=1 Tax=Romboutsia TaxID=1501226 RepID=UPI00216CE8B7|nr:MULTISPECIES: DUF2871 domain-containing protein [Romboutsia]MCI9061194.1 DUF2871 domain-containing protein [Romboutsia sp.]